ncbi:hypothetical protein QWY93_05725 [Echinicola jeungdonensis]|uniref:Two-component regulator propeller domain-containing protein n=1 Tax=Echinicola jeungdonensis TaxID=709343 RepID=A0ABV5J4U3_9BACT|nr:two-component regulator propeller domain-containing protein [Echinicola jeungdonensis]MDN3668822.1 hypothetical protein [Echinicola jeungdonensis]
MKKKNKFLLFLVALTAHVLSSNAQGQIPVGTWRMHPSYTTISEISGNNTTIFARGNQACFYFSVENPIPHPLTKKDGLYGQDFKKMAFSDGAKTLILTYPDGTVDLVKEDKIKTITLIRDQSSIQDKTIYSIQIQEKIAWMATAFGLVKLDLETGTIVDSYSQIGPQGSTLEVWDVAIQEQSIWITTPEGLWKGDRSANLKDFRNWQLLQLENPMAQLSFSGNSLFGLGEDHNIYLWNSSEWEWISGASDVKILKAIQGQLYFSSGNTIYSLNENGSFHPEFSSIEVNFLDFHISENHLFLATESQGVLAWDTYQTIFPNGPNAPIKSFSLAGKDMFGQPIALKRDGTVDIASPATSSKFEMGFWETLQGPTLITDIKYANQLLFAGTWGDGLWKKDADLWEKINLRGLSEHSFISDMALDFKNNLWLILLKGPDKLIKITPEAAISFNISGLIQPIKIKADPAGNLWILEGTSGNHRIRIFKPVEGINRILSSSQNLGNLPSAQVLDFDISSKGEIWIGTKNGVAYLPSIWNISSSSSVNAIIPFYQNRPLLSGQEIQALLKAPDGSIWLGTSNDGLWHFFPEQESLRNFHKSNSPLPSNDIQQLSLDPVYGELFIKTKTGALSYRGVSIPPVAQLEDLKIFPNPVRPDFSGLLSIEGLTNFATLKITNSVGRVVYSWKVRGGKSTWNLRDAKGNRIPPGVYMVYVANEMGTEKVAGKFLVL